MKYWKSSGNCAAFVLLVPVRFSSTSLHYSNVVWQLLSPYLWVIRLAFFISVHVEYWCFLTGTQCFTTQVPITLPQCTVLMKLFTRCKYLYRLKIIKKMRVIDFIDFNRLSIEKWFPGTGGDIQKLFSSLEGYIV